MPPRSGRETSARTVCAPKIPRPVAAQHPGSAVVLCAHGALIKCVPRRSVGNGSISTLERQGEDDAANPLGSGMGSRDGRRRLAPAIAWTQGLGHVEETNRRRKLGGAALK
eukprot:1300537-Prymnesium_polylepis.1